VLKQVPFGDIPEIDASDWLVMLALSEKYLYRGSGVAQGVVIARRNVMYLAECLE
jgi:hypothetical protein